MDSWKKRFQRFLTVKMMKRPNDNWNYKGRGLRLSKFRKLWLNERKLSISLRSKTFKRRSAGWKIWADSCLILLWQHTLESPLGTLTAMETLIHHMEASSMETTWKHIMWIHIQCRISPSNSNFTQGLCAVVKSWSSSRNPWTCTNACRLLCKRKRQGYHRPPDKRNLKDQWLFVICKSNSNAIRLNL